MLKKYLLIVIIFVSIFPAFGQEQQKEPTTFWCHNEMIIVPQYDVELARVMYENAIKFWQPYVPGLELKFKFRSDGVVGEWDKTISIERGDEKDEGGYYFFAEFFSGKNKYNDEKNCLCHEETRIVLYEYFFGLDSKKREKIFIHEIGHALGLEHSLIDNKNIMYSQTDLNESMLVDEDQKGILLKMYPLNKKNNS